MLPLRLVGGQEAVPAFRARRRRPSCPTNSSSRGRRRWPLRAAPDLSEVRQGGPRTLGNSGAGRSRGVSDADGRTQGGIDGYCDPSAARTHGVEKQE